jgi:hypothetical protein
MSPKGDDDFDDTSGGGREGPFSPPPGFEERMEAIARYMALDRRLEAVVAGAAAPPAWLAAWLHSRRGLTLPDEPEGGAPGEGIARPEERLAVRRAVRDSGVLPEDAGFFLVADQVHFLTEVHARELPGRVEAATEALWKEQGLEGWRRPAPDDVDDPRELRKRCPATWDGLYVTLLTRHGEADMARLYRTDRERFEERLARGRAYFYPPAAPEPPAPPPPRWARELVARVFKSGGIFFADGGPPGTYGYRVGGRKGSPEIRFNLTPGELVGGPQDGEVAGSRIRPDPRGPGGDLGHRGERPAEGEAGVRWRRLAGQTAGPDGEGVTCGPLAPDLTHPPRLPPGPPGAFPGALGAEGGPRRLTGATDLLLGELAHRARFPKSARPVRWLG